MPWFVYIAQAATGRYYTGITTNAEKRLATHNAGMGAKFARDQGTLKLVYVSAPFKTKSAARLREMQIKRWSGIKKEKLILGEWT